MEQRREVRVGIDRPAGVTVLGDCERRLEGRVVNLSGKGLCLAVPEPLTPGSPVRVVVDLTLFLGEITWCRRTENGCRVGIEVEHVLTNTQELAQLMRGILGEAAPAAAHSHPELLVRGKPQSRYPSS